MNLPLSCTVPPPLFLHVCCMCSSPGSLSLLTCLLIRILSHSRSISGEPTFNIHTVFFFVLFVCLFPPHIDIFLASVFVPLLAFTLSSFAVYLFPLTCICSFLFQKMSHKTESCEKPTSSSNYLFLLFPLFVFLYDINV